MILATATGLLTRTALATLTEHFDTITNHVVDHNQVAYSVSAATSEFVLTGRTVTLEGDVGLYSGEIRIPYTKVDVASLLPTPLLVELNYPLRFGELRTYLQSRYGIVLEAEEFATTTRPDVGLYDDIYLDTPLELTAAVVELVARPVSGRFNAGGVFRLRFTKQRDARRLNDVYRQTRYPEVSRLASSALSAGALNLFNAPVADCVHDLVNRHFGTGLDLGNITTTSTVLGFDEVQTLIHPKSTTLSPWLGAAEFRYRKSDIATLMPEALPINLSYPTTFGPLRSYLQNIYGLQVLPGEFAIVGRGEPRVLVNDNDPVGDDDGTIYPLDADGTLTLAAQQVSWKWQGRSRLVLQFVDSLSTTVAPKITNSAPDLYQGETTAFEYTASGGTAPYRFDIVAGTPPRSMSVNGVWSGSSLQGTYVYTVRVRDVYNRFSLRTEVVVVGPPLYTGPVGPFYRSAHDDKYFVTPDLDIYRPNTA